MGNYGRMTTLDKLVSQKYFAPDAMTEALFIAHRQTLVDAAVRQGVDRDLAEEWILKGLSFETVMEIYAGRKAGFTSP